MDTAAIDRAGLTPLQPELARVAAVRDAAGLRAAIGRLQELQTGVFFRGGVQVNEKNTAQYAVQFDQGGLT